MDFVKYVVLCKHYGRSYTAWHCIIYLQLKRLTGRNNFKGSASKKVVIFSTAQLIPASSRQVHMQKYNQKVNHATHRNDGVFVYIASYDDAHTIYLDD